MIMKQNLIKILKYSISVLIAGGLLYYAFQGIDTQEVIALFQKADYTWVFVSGILAILSHISRAYRWKYLLEPMGYSMSLWNAFLAVMSGYFMNTIIPRAGEVSRCGIIQKLDNVPADTAFGTVVLERIIDLIMLMLLTTIVFVVEFKNLSQWFYQMFEDKLSSVLGLGYLILFLGVLGLIALFLAYYFRNYLLQWTWVRKAKGVIQNVIKGVLSIRSVRNKPAFIFHTLFIWLMYYLMAYVLFFSFPETSHLDLWFGVLILFMGAIGMSMPVNGGTGAYHVLVGKIFLLRGLTNDDGTLMATFMHASQTLTILIVGGLATFISAVLISREKKKIKEIEPVLE